MTWQKRFMSRSAFVRRLWIVAWLIEFCARTVYWRIAEPEFYEKHHRRIFKITVKSVFKVFW